MFIESIIAHKPYFIKLAYNLLGEIQEAEDIVQDALTKYLQLNQSNIQNPKSYVAKMVVNQAINRLKTLQTQRQLYKGTWLPEPWLESIDNQQDTTEDYTIDYALLALLEKLNPYERAVFILRETFSLDYQEISEITGLNLANCRQVLHRAKEKLPQAKTKFQVDKTQHQNLLQAFLQACTEQNLEQLQLILKQDIAYYADGGGKVAVALKPLFGFNKVVKHIFGILNLNASELFDYQPVSLNGQLGVLIVNTQTQVIDSVICIEIGDAGIETIFSIRSPNKIHFKL